jgi:hypothetical protein
MSISATAKRIRLKRREGRRADTIEQLQSSLEIQYKSMRKERDKDREDRTFMTDGAEEVHGEVFLDEAALLHFGRAKALLRALCRGSFVPISGSQHRAGQTEKVIEDRRRKVERKKLSLSRSQGRLKGHSATTRLCGHPSGFNLLLVLVLPCPIVVIISFLLHLLCSQVIEVAVILTLLVHLILALIPLLHGAVSVSQERDPRQDDAHPRQVDDSTLVSREIRGLSDCHTL